MIKDEPKLILGSEVNDTQDKRVYNEVITLWTHYRDRTIEYVLIKLGTNVGEIDGMNSNDFDGEKSRSQETKVEITF